LGSGDDRQHADRPPAAAPTLNPATSGGAIDYGSHSYGVAFVTASGETTVGPMAQVNIGAGSLPNQDRADLAQSNTSASGWMPPNTTVYYEFTWVTASGETLASLNAMIVTANWPSNINYSWDTKVTVPGSTDARVTTVNIYRNSSAKGQVQNPNQWMKAGSVANNPSGGPCAVFDDDYMFASTAPPSVNTTDPNRTVPITGIPRGSSNVTARKVYRSTAGTLAMHLLVTLADNTTTSYTDALADAALGAGAQGTNTALGTVAIALTNIDRATGTSNAAGTARKLYGARGRWWHCDDREQLDDDLHRYGVQRVAGRGAAGREHGDPARDPADRDSAGEQSRHGAQGVSHAREHGRRHPETRRDDRRQHDHRVHGHGE
jgi:hypothetical protein